MRLAGAGFSPPESVADFRKRQQGWETIVLQPVHGMKRQSLLEGQFRVRIPRHQFSDSNIAPVKRDGRDKNRARQEENLY